MFKGVRLGLAALMAAALLGAAPSAFASTKAAPKAIDRGVEKRGQCSAGSEWKLKVGADNSQLEVEFEVDSNVVGQTWKVVLKDNDTEFFRGKRMTQAPSGSFEVRQFTENQPGNDHVVGKAKNPATGETCKGSINF
jgi:hypothetical protein